ncbi:hypothetical protein [Catenulispora rubra]|uniref:hypothetical protein n=1 Tax=Catenulispora rubra TaxID=280293 RepID=UPI001892016B|nr:hypothetical protein [Catenulispora rubra]
MGQVAGGGTNPRSEALIEITVPITDGEFFVFFADDASRLPSENAVQELKAAAWRYRAEAHRDPQSFAEVAVVSGMIGNAAWAASARGFVAIRAYWQRLSGHHQTVDAAAVFELVTRTCLSTLGKVPDHFNQAEILQGSDGSWQGEFTVGTTAITVQVDESGRLLHWTQRG